jgi:DivIVA domain-containing protein
VGGFDFSVVLRGYDPVAVDALLLRIETAMQSGNAVGAAELGRTRLPVVLRGYDRIQVEQVITQLVSGAPVRTPHVELPFTVVLRGYDRGDVDALVAFVMQALAAESAQERGSAAEKVRSARFALRLRGYDRAEVDRFLGWAVGELA